MAHKSREVYLWSLEVGKRHHRRRSVIAEKHRKLIDEVAKGGLGSFLSVVDLRGKELIRDLQLIAEKARLFRLGFKVLIPLVQEDKIEDSDAPQCRSLSPPRKRADLISFNRSTHSHEIPF